MADEPDKLEWVLDTESAHWVLLVCGSHLRAEIADRPLAYKLQQSIADWSAAHSESLDKPVVAATCCDVWYMQQENLQEIPSICIGGPGVNAFSQFFADHIPDEVLRENEVFIQLDPDFVDLDVCLWGNNHDLTIQAIETFKKEYLDDYLRAVATQVEPMEE